MNLRSVTCTPLLALAMSGAANAALVAWYPLDTDAMDASGNGHHGALVGTALSLDTVKARAEQAMVAKWAGIFMGGNNYNLVG